MYLNIYIYFLLFVSAYAVTHESNGTSIEVLGQSGKARIVRGETTVTMQVDYLNEIDEFDNEVGNIGQNKHSVNSFATQSFTFSDLVDKEYQNTSVQEFTFETPIYSIGKLKLVTMLVGESGEVGTETETWSVSAGDLKWNIELSDWTFCDPCADGTAKYIDVALEIKGSKSESKGNQTTDLGDATLQLSNRVVIDSEEIYMPTGYPKITTKGSKQLFVFRFPKFMNKAVYDPLLQIAESNAMRTLRPHPILLLVIFLFTV